MFRLPRFYPILDTAVAARFGLDAIEIGRGLVDAGVQLVQLRHKGAYTREAFATAERLAAIFRQADCRFVINDRADIARIVEADGAHLGQDDLPPAAARKVLGGDRILGFSTHSEAQLRAALTQPVDYFAVGPIFLTATKENPDPALGLSELGRLRRLTPRPLVAIGGITWDAAPGVWEAGADAAAVIGDWLNADWQAALGRWMRLANRFET